MTGHRRKETERDQKPQSWRYATRLQRCNGQCSERDELALRHKDDARHRKNQHKRDRDKRVDRTVDHCVLDEE